jgi:hypothetical protein
MFNSCLRDIRKPTNVTRVRWVIIDGAPQETTERITAPPFDLDFVVNVSNGPIIPDFKNHSFSATPTPLYSWPTLETSRLLERYHSIHFAPYDEAYDVFDWINTSLPAKVLSLV